MSKKPPSKSKRQKEPEVYVDYEIRNAKGECVELGFSGLSKLKARTLPEGHKLTLKKGD